MPLSGHHQLQNTDILSQRGILSSHCLLPRGKDRSHVRALSCDVVLSAAGNFPAFGVGVPMVLVGGVRSACAQEPLLSPLTLDHVDIRVSNVARSAGFYRDAAESVGESASTTDDQPRRELTDNDEETS